MNDGLPKGHTGRAAMMDDMQAALNLWNADALATIGNAKYHLSELEREWNHPGFNPETDIHLVIGPQGELSGYCEAWDLTDPHVAVHCWGCTHPQHVGLGIGTHLVKWAEQRARDAILKAPPEARVSMLYSVLSSNERAGQLLAENGFKLVRHFWRMVIDLDQPPPDPQWPEGIRPRQFEPDKDERAVFSAGQEAFSDHWGHIERPFEEAFQQWMHRIHSEGDLDPSLFTLAMDGDEIAGSCYCRMEAHDDPSTAWVSTLSVRRPWRRRGLGLALLQNAFAEFYRRGKYRVGLGVDAQNLTGAVRLYEKAGMHSDPNWEYSQYEKELRSGVELRNI
jgi:mycothiol synthase